MAAPPPALSRPAAGSPSATGPQPRYTSALSAVTTLFFLWGFITCLNDILIPYLKAIFQLCPGQPDQPLLLRRLLPHEHSRR
jgi:FHS family L-fucose permease-like MFS transporter